MENLCIQCNREVRRRQHAVSCDYCERWQHRLCDTGINITEYRNAMRVGHLDWVCTPCLVDANDEDEEPQVNITYVIMYIVTILLMSFDNAFIF